MVGSVRPPAIRIGAIHETRSNADAKSMRANR